MDTNSNNLNNPEYGDDKFKKYMENLSPEEKHTANEIFDCVLEVVKFKASIIHSLIQKSLDTYLKLNEKDLFLKDLASFIAKLGDQFIITMEQLSYTLDESNDLEERDD